MCTSRVTRARSMAASSTALTGILSRRDSAPASTCLVYSIGVSLTIGISRSVFFW